MKIWTTLACASALALAAAGCNPKPEAGDGNAQAQMALPALPATLPLEAGEATEIAPAPAASDLPDAPPLKLARVADTSQAYGYADAAYSYDEALGDAPPDYGFDYDGADPWAWQGYDDSLMVAEPIDDGYRYYYYRPGADEPYFVRDPFYSYGFAGGLLAVVYGADGGIVPYADYGPRLTYASRYYARGRQLWGASRKAKRHPVIAANWLRQRPVIVASRERWGSGRAHQPEWQRYYETNRPRQAAYWSAERVRRQADARRFDGWRQQGFRSSPPPRAIPPAWEKASWAKDDRRYRPAAEALREERKDDRRDARQDRQDARQDAQQQAQREQRQAERQQAQDQRRDAQQSQQRDGRQAERRQAQQQQQAQQREARQLQQREAEQARRQAERTQRQQQQQQARQPRPDRLQPDVAQRRDAQQAERRQAAQAEARRAQQADRAQRQQADRAAAREAQQAERQQAQQAAREQRQAEARQAQQAQRQQAQQAARQQAQAEQRQAAQAQRQQAQQAERQQQQARQREQQQQQQQAQRQQMQQQRQQQRQERRDARGPN